MRKLGLVLALALVTGCTLGAPGDLSFQNLTAESRRDYREAFFEVPFSQGPIFIVVTEGAELKTYTLGPCAQWVCGGTGRAGQLTRTADYWVVRGAYAGRAFHLAPGGDGYLERNGVFTPLAWD